MTKAIRRELRRTIVVEDDSVEEDDDDDEDDEDPLSNRDVESFGQAAAAWRVALHDLTDEAFGAASFGLIALGMMLDVVKKARRHHRQ